jgi:hypothetical protein
MSTSHTNVAMSSHQLHMVFISQLIRYAKACSTYDKFFIQGRQLTNNLSWCYSGFNKSRLQAAFRKLYVCYNDQVYLYKKWCLMCFIPIVRLSLTWWFWLWIVPLTWSGNKVHGPCDRSTGDAYFSRRLIPPLVYPVVCARPVLWFQFPTGFMRSRIVRDTTPFVSLDFLLTFSDMYFLQYLWNLRLFVMYAILLPVMLYSY